MTMTARSTRHRVLVEEIDETDHLFDTVVFQRHCFFVGDASRAVHTMPTSEKTRIRFF
jgi:hypothetical protein